MRPLPIRAQNVINTFLLTVNAVLPLIHTLIEKGYINIKCNVLKAGVRRSILQTFDLITAHRSCVRVNWMFLGWSMAQWHLLFSTGILILYAWSIVYAQKRYS